MSTANIVAEVVRNIVNQGKGVLKDHLIEREKVPPFSSRQTSSNYNEMVIHGGYQAQIGKKYSHFSIKKDSMPEHIIKDNLAIKSHQIIHQQKSVTKTQHTFIKSQQKYYTSKKKNRQNFSVSGHNIHLNDSSKQKQNQLIKLDENHNNRIVIQRVRQRIENEQEKMRQKKRQIILKQYQQKLQNQVFQKQRQDRHLQKQRLLQNHVQKGESFKFNFDHNGELMLFQSSNNLKKNYPPQTSFKIYSNLEEQGNQTPNQLKTQRKDQGQLHPLQRKFTQNQRIKSARGQAFASSVMKTVNLSRISMNASLAQVDAQQFMKRNDLFNNNHSRQTTSIPYLQPKMGTVYTEIATKQVVASSKEPHSSTTALGKDDISSFQQRDPSKKGKGFDGFYLNLDRKYAKTARVIGKKDTEDEDIIKTSIRPIKTAKQSARNSAYSVRRPQSSAYRGRITTVNEKLVQNLLSQ